MIVEIRIIVHTSTGGRIRKTIKCPIIPGVGEEITLPSETSTLEECVIVNKVEYVINEDSIAYIQLWCYKKYST